jgi:hypothetical protein
MCEALPPSDKRVMSSTDAHICKNCLSRLLTAFIIRPKTAGNSLTSLSYSFRSV